MSSISLYEVLEVHTEATASEIKRAYHRMALKYHPDKTVGSEDKFKDIQRAYDVLSDEDKRLVYDRYGDLGIQMMDRIPWLHPTVYHQITTFSLLIGFSVIILIVQFSFLCIRVDQLVNWSWHYVFIPLYIVLGYSLFSWSIVLLRLVLQRGLFVFFSTSSISDTFSMGQGSTSSSSTATEHDDVSRHRSTALFYLFVVCGLLVTTTFFCLMAFVLNGTIPFWYLGIPYICFELLCLIPTIFLLRQYRTSPFIWALLRSFYIPLMRWLLALLLFFHFFFTPTPFNWGVTLIPLFLLPLPWVTEWLLLLISPQPSKFKFEIGFLSTCFLVYYFMLALTLVKLETNSIPLAVIFIPIWCLLIFLVMLFTCCVPLAMTFVPDIEVSVTPIDINRRITYVPDDTTSHSSFSTRASSL